MNEKRYYKHNTLNNNKLQTLLITRVFATNFKLFANTRVMRGTL